MDQGYARAVSPEFESGNGGGVLGADDEDVGIKVGMRLFVVVRNLGEFLSRNIQVVRQVVVSGRED